MYQHHIDSIENLKNTTYRKPEDVGKILSRYTTDFEQWWLVLRPNINEW